MFSRNKYIFFKNIHLITNCGYEWLLTLLHIYILFPFYHLLLHSWKCIYTFIFILGLYEDNCTMVWIHILRNYSSCNGSFFSSTYNYTILLQFHFTVDYFFLRPYPAFSELVPLEYRAKSNAPRQLRTSAYLQKYANLRSLVNTGVQKWGGMSPKSVDSEAKVCLEETIAITFLTAVFLSSINF